jgi:hypothetical protein
LVRKAFQETSDTSAYLQRYTETTERIDELEKRRAERIGKSRAIGQFIRTIEKSEATISEFNEGIWIAVVDYAVIDIDGKITFRFKNGVEI